MPDWSYQTALRPVLFRLPVGLARDVTLGFLGGLARLPGGPALIHFLGHMRPDSRLRRTRLGIDLPAPVGLGAGIDLAGTAAPAFARFGFGFLELGPITARPLQGAGSVERDWRKQAIDRPDPADNPGAPALVDRLAHASASSIPLLVRLAPMPGSSPAEAVDDVRRMAALLAPHAAAFSLSIPVPAEQDQEPPAYLRDALRGIRAGAAARPLLLCLPVDLAAAAAERWLEVARAEGADGLLVDGTLRLADGRRRIGRDAREPALSLVRVLRERLGHQVPIIASGGVHEPIDAIELLRAGADLVLVDSGLVFSGPGLPKRINDAVLAYEQAGSERIGQAPRLFELTWFWTLLMGIGMFIGSFMALAIAATRVVLPYDEWFLGFSRAGLAQVNPHLLGFMTHDRVSLAGVMTSIGILYIGLSVFGIRRGMHWAMVTVVSSAAIGFFSFFLFLGFGYFDPFHAFVTAVLLQFLLLGMHSRLTAPEVPSRPNLFNDRAWRLSLWGQLFLLIQAVLFLLGGLVISMIGITYVFVPEDLEFMGTTAQSLAAASPRLVPLVAHDRASLGGMLAVSGLIFLCTTLWGFRRRACWLWWMILLASLPGFGATVAVHLSVGYTAITHLMPTFLGIVLFTLGLILSYPYLCTRDRATEDAWERLGPQQEVEPPIPQMTELR